jgi:hypothetical protein
MLAVTSLHGLGINCIDNFFPQSGDVKNHFQSSLTLPPLNFRAVTVLSIGECAISHTCVLGLGPPPLLKLNMAGPIVHAPTTYAVR